MYFKTFFKKWYKLSVMYLEAQGRNNTPIKNTLFLVTLRLYRRARIWLLTEDKNVSPQKF